MIEQFREFWDNNLSKVDGWLSPREAYALARVAMHVDNPVVEIGSYRGKSSLAIAWGLDCGSEVAFWSVDPHDYQKSSVFQQAEYDLVDLGYWYKNISKHFTLSLYIKKLTMPSAAARVYLSNTWLDMVFIDGSHQYEYVSDDCEWINRIVLGGIVLFHDHQEVGVREAITAAVSQYELRPLWVVDRLAAYGKKYIRECWKATPEWVSDLQSLPQMGEQPPQSD